MAYIWSCGLLLPLKNFLKEIATRDPIGDQLVHLSFMSLIVSHTSWVIFSGSNAELLVAVSLYSISITSRPLYWVAVFSLYHIPCFTPGLEDCVWLLNLLFIRDGESLESSSFALIVRSVPAESGICGWPVPHPGCCSSQHHFSCLNLVGRGWLGR